MKGQYIVADKFRTNPLSLEPGGHTVTVNYKDGHALTYDKIKNPKAFISKISSGPDSLSIETILVDNKPFSF